MELVVFKGLLIEVLEKGFVLLFEPKMVELTLPDVMVASVVGGSDDVEEALLVLLICLLGNEK